MKRIRPGRTKAAAFLRERLPMLGGCRGIPSVAALAAEAGVSYVTMWKAVRDARRSGEWERLLCHTVSAPPRSAAGKWERVRNALERDIIDGVFAHDARLPSVKELAARYGACAHTVRKATEALTRSGRLAMAPRGFRARSFVRRGKHRIVLFARGHSYGDLAENAPQRGCLRILEAECSRRGVVLQIEFVYRRAGVVGLTKSVRDIESEHPERGQTLGYVVWEQGMDEDTRPMLRRELQALAKPVAVWPGSEPPEHEASSSRMVRSFTTMSYHAIGIQIGSYLTELGHRSIALVAAPSADARVRRMLDGLRGAASSSSVGGSVAPFYYVGEICAAGAADATHVKNFVEDRLFPYGEPTGTTPRRRHRMMNQRMRVMRQIDRALRMQALQAGLKPHLREALSHQAITAWVAIDDTVGVECMNFLADRRVGVPRRLSVVGVGDSEEALLHNMTSYSFNYPALMHAMLDHVLGAYAYGVGSARCHRIEGFVVPRASTAAAPGRPRTREHDARRASDVGHA